MCVTLNQASLPTRTCKWRSSHHMSTVAARPSHQRRDAKLGRDASRATYCSSYARSVGTLGVVGFSGRHAISQAAVTNSAGPRVNSNIRDLQSLRRNFSFGKGYLEREGKNGHDR